jgi:hypothetical protein
LVQFQLPVRFQKKTEEAQALVEQARERHPGIIALRFLASDLISVHDWAARARDAGSIEGIEANLKLLEAVANEAREILGGKDLGPLRLRRELGAMRERVRSALDEQAIPLRTASELDSELGDLLVRLLSPPAEEERDLRVVHAGIRAVEAVLAEALREPPLQ